MEFTVAPVRRVLQGNEQAQRAWRAAGYVREEQWCRWVKPLSP
ncbi:hypothetical protein [Saccharothrix sp. ST-888]|nr:hypothetical protein [Saccharothrix sp. ST-888]